MRGLLSILHPVSRLYLLFLSVTLLSFCLIPFRVVRWIRSPQAQGRQTGELVQVRIAKLERNMLAFFQLHVLFFCASFCNQLVCEIRSELSLMRNPNLDIIEPFDGLLTIADLGFAGLVLIHCLRCWVSAKAARLSAAS